MFSSKCVSIDIPKQTLTKSQEEKSRKTRPSNKCIKRSPCVQCNCFVFYICNLLIKLQQGGQGLTQHTYYIKKKKKTPPKNAENRCVPACQEGWLWNIKMHIFSLCALGSSYCSHPWSNLSIEEGTEKVNTCHSVSACFTGDWCMPVRRRFFVCLLLLPLSFSRLPWLSPFVSMHIWTL